MEKKLKSDGMMAKRIILAVAGMAICGVSIAFFKQSVFGVDPFQCFANGIAGLIPLRFGTTYMLINMALLVIDFFLDRHYIGISTFINMFLLGYMVEFSESLLIKLFGTLSMPMRIAFLIIGILTTCIAAALYYTADLGVSTYDAIPLHIADLKPRLFGRVLPFRVIRIISDCVCTLTGVLLGIGRLVGIGTIITALFMGPLITFFKKTISDPLLYGKK